MSSVRTLPGSPRGTSASGADRGDPGGDLGVGRRHDLAAVAEVDLVAVVLRRVVARRHHHTGHAAELADRERQQGSGQRPRHHQRAQPGAGHHLGGVAGEDVGVVAGVVPDDDGGAGRGAVVLEVRRQAGGRPGDDDAVHPVGAGAERAPQARRPELQRAVEAVGEVVRVAGPDERLELGLGERVGVLGRPAPARATTVQQVAHGRRLVVRCRPLHGVRREGARRVRLAGPWRRTGHPTRARGRLGPERAAAANGGRGRAAPTPAHRSCWRPRAVASV